MSTIKSLVTENNATVVDVRGPWEFEDSHIEGALNIPLDEIPSRMDEVKSLKLPIIVYCRSGNRSGMAEIFIMVCSLETEKNLFLAHISSMN